MIKTDVYIKASRIRHRRVELQDRIQTVKYSGIVSPEFYDPAAALIFKMLSMEPASQ